MPADYWHAPAYWDQVGDFDEQTPIVFDREITGKVMGISRALTGV